MIANQGKIEGLRLSNFTCFADLEVSSSEGINVIIGENGLGKTHLLKVIFAPIFYGIPGFETFDHVSSPEIGFIMSLRIKFMKLRNQYGHLVKRGNLLCYKPVHRQGG